MTPHIRAKVVCLFFHQDRYLLAEGFDPSKQQHYLMPVGGGIEFGEHSATAIAREVQEELGAQISNLRLLKVFEHVFTFDGIAGHEIVFAYQADFADAAFTHQSVLRGVESNGDEFNVRWLSRADIAALAWPVFPEGILDEVSAASIDERF